MGAIVNSPEPMSRMRVITSRDRTAHALKVLQKSGVLHVEESTELKPADLDAIEKERRQVSELLTGIEDVLKSVPAEQVVKVKQDVDVYFTRPVEETSAETRALCARLAAMDRRARKLQDEKSALVELKSVAAALADRTDLTVADLSFSGEHLFSRLAALPQHVFAAVGAQLEPLTLSRETVTLGENTYALVIGKSSRLDTVEAWVRDNGGRILPAPKEPTPLREFVSTSDQMIARLDGDASVIFGDIRKQTMDNLETLLLLREALFAENDRLGVLEKATNARYVTLIEGWVPVSAVEKASGDLREEVGYVYIDTRPPTESEQPPTKQRNSKVLSPFEIIVNLFGTPKYREWDPTPIVAVSFTIFYGIMLGDVVYAICVLLIAKYALPRLVDDPYTEGFRKFQILLSMSAVAGLVVGLLSGTYLGDFLQKFLHLPSLALSATVQAVYSNTLTFILVSLVIGIVHVNIGHILMFIRGIREGKKYIIVERLGLWMLQIFGIPWIFHFIGHDLLPLSAYGYSILLYVVYVAIVLLIVGSIMERGKFLGSIFWVFDITGILGDVMSYARLAGVGLATYYLAYCFNLMSVLIASLLPEGIVRIVLGTLVTIVILLFGHTLNVALGAITCFAHSIRLCFVEFLFKFYEGGGRTYSPLRIRKRDLIPVQAKS
ncbi:MAG: V-type ATP synthase subunit I [Dehalococcoidia bacterium]|nr:V-type ATP synthase subunit I [Dehalococcoidia bacterium]